MDKLDLANLNLTKRQISLLIENEINNIEDLVNYLPRKYYDFTTPKFIKDFIIGEKTCFIGKLDKIKKGNGVIICTFKDSRNWFINCSFFKQPYIVNYFKPDKEYIICGQVIQNEFQNKIYKQFIPLMFSDDIESLKKIVPVYKSIENIGDKTLESIIYRALEYYKKNILIDYIDNNLKTEFNLCSIEEAYNKVHFPLTLEDVEKGKNCLLFDMLFRFNVRITYEKKLTSSLNNTTKKLNSFKTCVGLTESIPFELTEDQKKAIKYLYGKMKLGNKISALVQGDVGCGKTMVAIFLALACAENGYQSVILAPTEILASQHYKEIKERLEQFKEVNVGFLSGSTKKKEKEKIKKGIEDGSINIIVGTHAVFSEGIKFKNLYLSIVDEQHRFGVEQREKLKTIHNIDMSATPIPRTLGLAVYGNLVDIINIKTKPSNRKSIITKYIKEEEKVYNFMLSQIKEGRQCYVVCPLIEESESKMLANVQNVNQTFLDINNYFSKLGYSTGLIYGGKTKKDKERNDIELEKFKNNEHQILIATTIVEVGVNVPNSTVIVIKNSERFGLAQLHQLRGRVGRGEYQSYCILQSPKENDRKIKIMCSTNDGFKIAEYDMELRGAGDFLGNRQSGYNKYIESIITHPELFDKIQEKINKMFKDNSISKYSILFGITV